MLTTNQIKTIKERLIETKNEEGLALLMTIEQMIKESWEKNETILKKVASLESDMNRLVEENERHFRIRESAFVERDACIGLMVKMATKLGMHAGVIDNNVVLDLPSGQVHWDFAESEAHLFEQLPPYGKAMEDMGEVEKYTRVMNPGI